MIDGLQSFRLIVWGLVLCAAFNLAAQDRGSAGIYHVEGRDFSITLNNERTIFPGASAGAGGIRLEPAGIVHTGAGTFLELQIAPSNTVIKVSENTSLIYNGVDGTGNAPDFGLLYGRIRVISGNGSAAANPVVIRSEGVSARIKEGDFGIDYLLDPGSRSSTQRPVFRVYAFWGSAEIFPYGKEGSPAQFGGLQSLAVGEWESLSLDISPSYTFAEKTPVGAEIVSYWTLHNFSGTPPGYMPSTTIAEPGGAPAPVQSSPLAGTDAPIEPNLQTQARPDAVKNRGKNMALAMGIALTVSSVAVQGICFSQFDTSRWEAARLYFPMAYGTLGLGLITTLVGILGNPQGQ